MKPKPRTIQFLLPTASPGEIELVYRELLGVIGEDEPEYIKVDGGYAQPKMEASDYYLMCGRNQAREDLRKKLANFFGKEG